MAKIFAPFRFTIGRRTYSGSVKKLQIGFATGILMQGAREAQTGRILSKRHPKHPIKITLPFLVYFVVDVILIIILPNLNYWIMPLAPQMLLWKWKGMR